MDDDFESSDYALIIIAFLFLLSPIFIIVFILGAISFSSTKKWHNERLAKLRQSSSNTADESGNLLPEGTDEEDFVDSEEEADYHKFKAEQKAEEERDASITFGQKWWSNFKKTWTGNMVSDYEKKKKEREERKKMAKAVARQLNRIQRRRERGEESETASSSEMELPTYNKATSGAEKH